jgi:ubiquinone/menaquinone biosynthesis C-methylase UbiE
MGCVPETLSFDPIVDLYDETRIFDADCFRAALDELVARFPPVAYNKLLEPGIGTGRIALPLAGVGYNVTGVDISANMLALLQKRRAQSAAALPVCCQRANVMGLPFADAAFDIAVAVHLFYFIRGWKQAADELLRVVRCDGPVILMHTGMGAEVPLLNQRYKALCAEQGFDIPTLGVASTRDVVVHYERAGCRVAWVRDRWQWTSHLRLDKALDYIAARVYSFTMFAPDAVHRAAVERLAAALEAQYGTLNTVVEVPNQVNFAIVLRG